MTIDGVSGNRKKPRWLSQPLLFPTIWPLRQEKDWHPSLRGHRNRVTFEIVSVLPPRGTESYIVAKVCRGAAIQDFQGAVDQVDAGTNTQQARSLVIGGTGLVGGYIVEQLVRRGERPFALSRSPREGLGVDWLLGDLVKPDTLKFPAVTTLYCTADAVLLANALPRLFTPSLKRIVAFSSTSVLTKQDTEVATERDTIRRLTEAEQKIAQASEQHGVGWTILRPTLIYGEGRDTNITPLSRLIRRFGFMPLVGGAPGLRQPVHAEDLAIGAIAAAASPAAANKFYSLPGAETLTYREMIGRVFDGLRLPRRTIAVPVFVWRASFALAKPLFPGANVAMGIRMTKDMTFDSTPAIQDFGWNPRAFKPVFDERA